MKNLKLFKALLGLSLLGIAPLSAMEPERNRGAKRPRRNHMTVRVRDSRGRVRTIRTMENWAVESIMAMEERAYLSAGLMKIIDRLLREERERANLSASAPVVPTINFLGPVTLNVGNVGLGSSTSASPSPSVAPSQSETSLSSEVPEVDIFLATSPASPLLSSEEENSSTVSAPAALGEPIPMEVDAGEKAAEVEEGEILEIHPLPSQVSKESLNTDHPALSALDQCTVFPEYTASKEHLIVNLGRKPETIVPYKEGIIVHCEDGKLFIGKDQSKKPDWFKIDHDTRFIDAHDNILVLQKGLYSEEAGPNAVSLYDLSALDHANSPLSAKELFCINTIPLTANTRSIALMGGHLIVAEECENLSPTDEEEGLNGNSPKAIEELESGQLRIIDIRTGECLRKIGAHFYGIDTIRKLSETLLLTKSYKDKEIKVWDLTTGTCIRTISLESFGEQNCYILDVCDATILLRKDDRFYTLNLNTRVSRILNLEEKDIQDIKFINSQTVIYTTECRNTPVVRIHHVDKNMCCSSTFLHDLSPGSIRSLCYHPELEEAFIVDSNNNLFSVLIELNDSYTQENE